MTGKGIRTALLAAILGFFAIGGLAVSDAISPLGEPMVDTVGNVLLKAGIKLTVHVANTAELGSYRYHGAVVRDDVGAQYAYSASACSISGGDIGSQIPGYGGTGCWLLNVLSGKVTPFVFNAAANSNGTTGNGHDDTAALQAWLNYGATTGAKLVLPSLAQGRFYRTTAPLTVPFGVRIDGDYCSPGPNGTTGWVPGAGSTFFFDHPGRGINFNAGESTLRDVCTYRAQPDPAGVASTVSGSTTSGSFTIFVSTTSGLRLGDPISGQGIQTGSVISAIQSPTAFTVSQSANATASGVTLSIKSFTPGSFDWDFAVQGADLDLVHDVIINPTNGIYLGTGRLWINGLKGRPLSVGIQAYDSLDTDKWDDIHFWPFSGLASDGSISAVLGWQLNNLKSFLLYRMDDAQLSNISVYGAAYCFYFSSNPLSGGPASLGASNLLSATNVLCDAIGNGSGIYVDSSVGAGGNQPLTADFVNFKTQANNGPSSLAYTASGVDIEGSGNRLTFNGGFYSGFASGAGVIVNGTGNRVTLPDARFYGWGVRATTSPAIFATMGNIVNYGASLPFFDASSGVQDGFTFGGPLYTLANASSVPVPFTLGSGQILLQDLGSHNVANILAGNGSVSLTQSGSEFVALAGDTDANIAMNTPSGKVGLAYSTTQSSYVAYNKTGAPVNYWYQTQFPIAAP